MQVSLDARDFGRLSITEAHELHHADLKAINSKDDPNRVAPAPLAEAAVDGSQITAMLKPASWNVLRLEAR
jgi:alpha-N-arabinofuranosidase